ncbi:pheromone A receptor-domain-containing protein [Russula ochroleuca]|uniref:Pheromone A receptor-domain-containing protein n=1 Tax=Russula ochroleuca TaxID=152965 RepID=A0A9P5JYA0_9AGAM|nr:pheromone A receptor-domain-containing protein [Russula ochroleuca]
MRSIIYVDIWDVRDPCIEYIRNSLRPRFTPGLAISSRAQQELSFSSILSITPHLRTTMSSHPNQLYSALSFIGFVMCAIPFYWHLEAWNTATCLFMIWTGLGCLMQSINSIVWNGNMINRAPVYCDIFALNVAIPACINRRLYKIATANAAMTTHDRGAVR